MMFADDSVGMPCGGREVNMTEYTWIRGKITRRERGMMVSRLKTQLMDFAFEQNEYGNRKPMKIIGEELERLLISNASGRVQKRNVAWQRR